MYIYIYIYVCYMSKLYNIQVFWSQTSKRPKFSDQPYPTFQKPSFSRKKAFVDRVGGRIGTQSRTRKPKFCPVRMIKSGRINSSTSKLKLRGSMCCLLSFAAWLFWPKKNSPSMDEASNCRIQQTSNWTKQSSLPFTSQMWKAASLRQSPNSWY